MKVGQVLLDLFCPIGAEIKTTDSNYNPNTLFNGTGCKSTWDLTTCAGKVTVGYDANDSDFNTIGKTGGEKTHKLTITEMPSHSHTYGTTYPFTAGGNLPKLPYSNTSTSYNNWNSSSTGGNGYHNNLQPYIVKYIWTRTS